MARYEKTVLTEFESIYTKWLALLGRLGQALKDLGQDPSDEERSNCLNDFSADLLAIVDNQTSDIARFSREDRLNLNKMKFAAAAYFDDYLLQRYVWGGLPEGVSAEFRKDWLGRLIEWRAFGTKSAGRKFPLAVEDSLSSDTHSQADQTLLSVYARILWLGFGPEELSVANRNNSLIDQINRILLKQEESDWEKTRDQPLGWIPPPGLAPKRMAPIKRWQRAIAYSIVGFVALSLISWLGIVFYLSSSLEAIT